MLHYIYVKSLLLLFKYYSLLKNVVCYKYVSFLVLFSIQFIIKSHFPLMHFLYLPLPPPFHNSEKTLHNSFACGYHVVR